MATPQVVGAVAVGPPVVMAPAVPAEQALHSEEAVVVEELAVDPQEPRRQTQTVPVVAATFREAEAAPVVQEQVALDPAAAAAQAVPTALTGVPAEPVLKSVSVSAAVEAAAAEAAGPMAQPVVATVRGAAEAAAWVRRAAREPAVIV